MFCPKWLIEQPIVHTSKALLPAETLLIIFAFSTFHQCIHGWNFTLQTDHKPLLTIFGSKKSLPTHTANRLQRWGTILLNHDFKMVYPPPNKFVLADGLSRLIPKIQRTTGSLCYCFTSIQSEWKITICNLVRELPVTINRIKQEAFRDEYINQIKTKKIGKGPAYCRRFLYMQRCVTLQRTRRHSVDIEEMYFERFSRWLSRD